MRLTRGRLLLLSALAYGGLVMAAVAVVADAQRDDPAPPPVVKAPSRATADPAANRPASNRASGRVGPPQPPVALVVETVRPGLATLPDQVSATGNIAAWQDIIIGAETSGLRLARVLVGVGSVVKAGDLLAEFDSEALAAEQAQAQAALAEAEAAAVEATHNAQRARQLVDTGALSDQQILQFTTAERSAQARLQGLRAAARVQALRLKAARVRAPDDGVIASRSATAGAVLAAGQEMFRLIRQGRLEWRAELSAADMARLRPGMPVSVMVSVQVPGAAPLAGRLRELAPTVDPATRNGLAYVDLPAQPGLRAGMFARGDFPLGSSPVLTLPPAAVQLRDGQAVVAVVMADQKADQRTDQKADQLPAQRVRLVPVVVGRRSPALVEVISGLAPDASVVAMGVGLLNDGDVVRVVGPAK